MAGTIPETRAGQWPAARPRPVDYRLAGRHVTREMYEDAQTAKRRGLRVILTTPGFSALDDAIDTETCANCGGIGRLYLQSIVAGPYKDIPAHNPAGDEHIGFINGGWYKLTLNPYSCPVCRKEIAL